MMLNMRGVWGVLSRVGATVLLFGGTVRAVDNFRLHDSFFTVVVDSTLDARTNAYVDHIKTTKAKLKRFGNNPIIIREVGEMWINSAKHGKIAQIYPGYYGESLIEGPKGEIFRTCAEIASKLSERAEKEVEAGDANGFTDAIRSIEVINIVRFGSYETLFTSSAYMRKPIKILKGNLDKLTPELTARLQKAQDPNERAYKIQLLEQVVRRQRNQYALRYGAEMTKQDDSSYVAYLSNKGQNIAAEHFFGFDRELGYSTPKKHK